MLQVEKIVYKPCEEDARAGNRTNNWGRPGYVHCEQPYSWSEVLHGYKDSKIAAKVGGLGKLLVRGGYETWICILGHFCGDPYFCWVYHEADKVFTHWGTNGELKLVR